MVVESTGTETGSVLLGGRKLVGAVALRAVRSGNRNHQDFSTMP